MTPNLRLSRVIFYSLIFLLFFQLVADFIETIYAFGLLNTNIPPEIVSILLFFSPLVLLIFRRGLPRQVGLVLVALAALSRPLELILEKGSKMLTNGLGLACLLVFIPLWLSQAEEKDDPAALEMGTGLAAALTFSILLRALGAGSDFSILHSWISWVLALGLIALAVWVAREQLSGSSSKNMAEILPGASFWTGPGLSVGILGVMVVLYFAFTSPTVLARWSGVDYALIVGLLGITLWLYFAALTGGFLANLSKPVLWAWNALFILTGTLTIWINQVNFPAVSSAYPFDQPGLTLWQQVPLLAMLVLSPVALLDLLLLVREVKARRPSPRTLAGGFSLAALFFLMVVVGQILTTVYDYIPVVGPLLRDREWMVFLFAGLGMGLPILLVQQPAVRLLAPSVFRTVFFPLLIAALLAAFVWVFANDNVFPSPISTNGALRVVTYNIQQGYSVDGKRSYAEQLAVLRGLHPDVVGLEESDTARFSGGNADVVRTIAEGLGMNVYYGPRTVTGTFGIALLSRYPIEEPHTFYMYSTAEQTAAIEAQISLGGKHYTILVTHLGNDGPIIQQQNVLSRLDGKPNVIAVGDFNFDQSTPEYALTLRTLEDAWVMAGSKPASRLEMNSQIDHVFISPEVKVRSANYVNSPASDHPALLAEIIP